LCPAELVGGHCKYPGVCEDRANVACQPLANSGGWGLVLGPMNGSASLGAPDAAAPSLAIPPLEIAGAALLAASAASCYPGEQHATLFALLGAAALAYVLVTTRRLAWWAWTAAAIAAFVCLAGPRSGPAMSVFDVLANTI
jgi:hypothetical protein